MHMSDEFNGARDNPDTHDDRNGGSKSDNREKN